MKIFCRFNQNPKQLIIRNTMNTHRFTLRGKTGIVVGLVSIVSGLILRYLQRRHLSGNMDIAVLPISFFELFQLFLLGLYVVTFYLIVVRINKKTYKLADDAMVQRNKKIRKMILLHLIFGFIISIILYKTNYFRLIIPVFCAIYGLLRLIVHFKYAVGQRWLGYLFLAAGILIFLIPNYDLIIWGFSFGVIHILYGALTLSHQQNLVNT